MPLEESRRGDEALVSAGENLHIRVAEDANPRLAEVLEPLVERLAAPLELVPETPYVFDGAIPTVKCFFQVVDVRDRDVAYLMVKGVDEKGAILSHPSAQHDAEKLARDVIAKVRTLIKQEL